MAVGIILSLLISALCFFSICNILRGNTASATTGAATATSQCRTFNGRRFCGGNLENVRVRLDRQISDIERSESEYLGYRGGTICGTEAQRVVVELKAAKKSLE
jgi:hypothetical protein